MSLRIAIQPDRVRQANGELQSYSARWAELAAERGVDVRTVDVRAQDFFASLSGCDAFMWRFGYDAKSLLHAKRLLPAIEHGMQMPVFPSWTSAWHFEDKIAQRYLLAAAGIPMPRTWIWWDKREALEFCRAARYPLVLKLAAGYQSGNVRILRDFSDARRAIERLFGAGVVSLTQPRDLLRRLLGGRFDGVRLLAGRPLPLGTQHGYAYLQEYLPGNEFDTRVTVIGDRAYAFRRFNRPGDFRASGSGRIDWNPTEIDLPTVRTAFRIARHLRTQSIAIDGLRRGDERLVGEISYTYASWALRDCPGRWVLHGDPESGSLEWVEGTLRAEDAIFDDFMRTVVSSAARSARGASTPSTEPAGR
jgi:glutathione synthase/RimK-type ligase-like ATP-grasp enzyme